jgi:NDP-sugar pyrophosphorylase family protein
MKAVLLAAGRGTRLAPLTDSIPKILAPLGGRPVLEHQLDYLARNGVTGLGINVHHHSDQVVAALEAADPPFPVRVSVEPELLGTAGALVPLSDFLTATFVLLYGDVVTNADLRALVERHRAAGGIATLAYYRSSEVAGKGVLTLDDEGRMASFLEKPPADLGFACVNAGIYALEPEILDFLGPGASDFGLDVWNRVIASGRPVYGHELDAYLRDIGSPEALQGAEEDLVAGGVRW